MNNGHQLQLAWYLYSGDFGDNYLPAAGEEGTCTTPNWCYGRMDQAGEDTNTLRIKAGLLFTYTKSLTIYKCPDIRRWPSKNPDRPQHVDERLDESAEHARFAQQWTFRQRHRLSQTGGYYPLGDISPATCWVTIDENDYSINDAWFVVSPYSVNAGLVNARKYSSIYRAPITIMRAACLLPTAMPRFVAGTILIRHAGRRRPTKTSFRPRATLHGFDLAPAAHQLLAAVAAYPSINHGWTRIQTDSERHSLLFDHEHFDGRGGRHQCEAELFPQCAHKGVFVRFAGSRSATELQDHSCR